MPAVDRLIPDLGPDFDGRWQRTSQALRRELIGEVRSLYRLLTEEDLPMLDSLMPAPAPAPATPVKPPAPQQTSLFGQADTAATKDNPFLPQSIRERLQHSQPHTAPRPQPTTPSPGEGDPYCIMIPPPNVTGSLHMGHGFNNTIMDCLIRYRRMQGRNTLWQPGTDHAGIATQMVVERQLAEQNITRHDLGREKFLEKVWEWKAQSGGTITRQIRRLGSSVDWSRERFTMDDGLSNAVKEAFVRLYDDGLIYRGKRLVNWDPKLHTAISDLEVLSEEEKGSAVALPLPAGKPGWARLPVVATTRPETMLGDTAVAVNPDDERYQHLIGKNVCLPLTGRLIPVIADELCRQGIRHRLREDHPGPRLQRLRSRQAPQPAADQHL
jgi:hypothetical protein